MQNNEQLHVEKIEQNDLDNYTLTIRRGHEEENLQVSGQSLIAIELLSPRIITQAEYTTLVELSAESMAYQKALNFLSYRKRSVYEIKTYLIQKQAYEPPVAKQVVEKLLVQRYLDDEGFIHAFIMDAFITSSKGPRKLAFELKQKYRCEEVLVERKISELYGEEQLHMMIAKVLKKLLRKKYTSFFQAQNKMQQKLYEAGYPQEIVVLTLEQITTELITIDDIKIQQILARTYRKLQSKEISAFTLRATLEQKLVQNQIDFDEARSLVDTYLLENI